MWTYIEGKLALPCGASHPHCGVLTPLQARCGAYRCEAHLAEHEAACNALR